MYFDRYIVPSLLTVDDKYPENAVLPSESEEFPVWKWCVFYFATQEMKSDVYTVDDMKKYGFLPDGRIFVQFLLLLIRWCQRFVSKTGGEVDLTFSEVSQPRYQTSGMLENNSHCHSGY